MVILLNINITSPALIDSMFICLLFYDWLAKLPSDTRPMSSNALTYFELNR